jgi:hypothetical protein
MSDFNEKIKQFWLTNGYFDRFISSGLLDFAVFDAQQDSHISLRISKQILTPSSTQNPIIFIANYVLCSLVQDVFRIQKGCLMEGLFSIESPQ